MPLQLHLGCGSKRIPGFEHVDSTPYPHLTHCADVSRLDMYAADSVDLIYASHVLEHFGRHDFRAVLCEWHRVLRPGGVLRLSVPDFETVVRLYPQYGLVPLLGLVCGGQKNATDYHHMVFDAAFLRDTLHELGFVDVRPWDWRTTAHAAIDDYSQAYLPHMDKTHGELVSLNLEATKMA